MPAVFALNADAINPPAAAPPSPPMIAFLFCCHVVFAHPDNRNSKTKNKGVTAMRRALRIDQYSSKSKALSVAFR
jgi:hypothetical protein